ncbi:thyroid adenoma-associated protein homolog [Stegostoma tigrinum]|uniref:thyroid adenoma-associated protein homolog n=1 Tax=Stegostoma tigrinum TaxID=3053191 RepID=UPI00202B9700|nr:thyroid adenoma-associated protein homolog [Stegostoma tigrinum]
MPPLLDHAGFLISLRCVSLDQLLRLQEALSLADLLAATRGTSRRRRRSSSSNNNNKSRSIEEEDAVIKKMQSYLLERQGVLSVTELQTVSACVKKNVSWFTCNNHLELLLNRVSDTFSHLLKSENKGNKDWTHLTVKICLQIFQAVPKSIGAIVWRGECGKEALQRIVGFLFQAIVSQSSHTDSRLLASTTLAKLVNSNPQPQVRAVAALHALQLTQGEIDCLILGELKVTFLAKRTDGLGNLLMSRGLVSCNHNEMLVCQLPGFQSGASVLLDLLFPVIVTHCEDKRSPVLSRAFQVLTLWLKCIKSNIGKMWRLRAGRLLDQHSTFTTQLLELMWHRIESPVEGLLDSVHCSFRLFFDIYRQECSHFGDVDLPLYSSILHRLKALPWQVKAKYLLLSSLVSCFGADKILGDYEELPKHLFNCLSTNHLCSVASELYRTILQQHRLECTLTQGTLSEQELAESWAQSWLQMLAEALTSDIPLYQLNTANYFLGKTLKIFPASFHLLARAFDGSHSEHRLGWITLVSAKQMTSGSLPMEADTLRNLRATLHCLDDRVRLRALALLCISPKTNQALSSKAMSLLKEFLPLNLNCSSSSFRQLLQVSVKKALVRIRDSCLLNLRALRRSDNSKNGGEGYPGAAAIVFEGVGFVQWLLELSVSSLLPGLNYQRKKTALLLMEALLETCTDSWSPNKRKGQPPQDMTELLNLARQSGSWDFFSQSNLQILLGCLMDGTNEIRELASKLLVNYLPVLLAQPLAAALFEHAVKMLCSSRVSQAEAGALIVKTALQKSDISVLLGVVAHGEATEDACFHPLIFVTYLHQQLVEHYRVACTDLLQAAKTKPLHGLILALRKCLTEVPEILSSLRLQPLRTKWRLFISQLMDTLSSISHFLLNTLAGTHQFSSWGQGTAPSLADMGIAIKAVIAVGKGLESNAGEDSVLLTEDDKLIQTCCWVTLREIGLLLGYLVELELRPHTSASSAHLLSMAQIQNTAGIFLDMLLKCRHWGVVEGCSAGFTKFCAALLKQQSPELQSIPRQILEQGLSGLRSPRSSSITRRAAGLPMLLLSVVAGEDSETQPLLQYCMKTLLDIANTPLSSGWDQTIDLPQVCSVHTLKTLTQSSVLGSAVLTYTSDMATLCLQGLSSASWAMRNAAIQLLSTLTCHVLGKKCSGDDSAWSGVTACAFFLHYPELKSLLLKELYNATNQDSATVGGHFHLYPSLHSILNLLAKLQPSVNDTNGVCSRFLHLLMQLAANPIHSVRMMSAKALVALVPLTEYSKVLASLVRDLPPCGTPTSHNRLHGQLLQMEAVLEAGLDAGCLIPRELQDVVKSLEMKLWLVSQAQRCPLIQAAYLKIVSLILSLCSEEFLCSLQLVLLAELETSPTRLMIGSGIFRRAATRYLCAEAVRAGNTHQLERIGRLLLCEDLDIRLAALTWIMQDLSCKEQLAGSLILKLLLSNLQVVLLEAERSLELLRSWLEAIVFLQENLHKLESKAVPEDLNLRVHCIEILLSKIEVAKLGPILHSQVLRAVSVLLAESCQVLSLALLMRWVTLLELCSDPTSSEILRLGAATSLVQAGVTMITWALMDSLRHVPLVVRITNGGIRLLQDEDPRVRTEAAKFATQVYLLSASSSEQLTHFQPNRALLCLLEFLLQNCWDCKQVFEVLMQYVPAVDVAAILVELRSEKAANLYEEDEPNVFAEPAIFATILLPFLLRIVEKWGSSAAGHGWLKAWAIDNHADIVKNMKQLNQRWIQGFPLVECFNVLAAANFYPAFVGLLVRLNVLFHHLQTLESVNVDTSDTGGPSCRLQADLQQLYGLITEAGLVPVSMGLASWWNAITER